MAQIIQIKRRIPGTGKPPSGTGAGQVRVGELATTVSAVGAGGVANLYIGDGTYVHDLVSNARQVELTGDQTITGEKTIDVTDLKITGGADGDVLTTDGSGELDWVAPSKGVESGTTAPSTPEQGDLWFNTTTQQLMVYNGSAWRIATHTTVAGTAPTTPAPQDGDTWFNTGTNTLMVRSGAAWVPALTAAAPPIDNFSTTETYAVGDFVLHGGHLYRAHTANGPGAFDGDDWDQVATTADIAGQLLSDLHVEAPITGDGLSAGTALGVTMATTAQINTGTDDTYPIDSAGLRTQTGAAVSTLDTTAKTIVPAINELFGDLGTLQDQLGAITGALRFVGNFDADQSEVVSAATGTLTVGANLPAAAAGNEGWYVIVTEAGTPAAPAPTEAMQVGDWIVSNGTAWIHVPLYHAAVTAGNVALSPVVNSWNNVQAAIAGLYTLAGSALETVAVDGVSIIGDGTSGDPLEVATVDGGTF